MLTHPPSNTISHRYTTITLERDAPILHPEEYYLTCSTWERVSPFQHTMTNGALQHSVERNEAFALRHDQQIQSSWSVDWRSDRSASVPVSVSSSVSSFSTSGGATSSSSASFSSAAATSASTSGRRASSCGVVDRLASFDSSSRAPPRSSRAKRVSETPDGESPESRQRRDSNDSPVTSYALQDASAETRGDDDDDDGKRTAEGRLEGPVEEDREENPYRLRIVLAVCLSSLIVSFVLLTVSELFCCGVFPKFCSLNPRGPLSSHGAGNLFEGLGATVRQDPLGGLGFSPGASTSGFDQNNFLVHSVDPFRNMPAAAAVAEAIHICGTIAGNLRPFTRLDMQSVSPFVPVSVPKRVDVRAPSEVFSAEGAPQDSLGDVASAAAKGDSGEASGEAVAWRTQDEPKTTVSLVVSGPKGEARVEASPTAPPEIVIRRYFAETDDSRGCCYLCKVFFFQPKVFSGLLLRANGIFTHYVCELFFFSAEPSPHTGDSLKKGTCSRPMGTRNDYESKIVKSTKPL